MIQAEEGLDTVITLLGAGKYFATAYKKWGLRGRKASPLLGAGMDTPLIESLNTSFSKTSFSDAKDAPPQLD
jgi:hypothetical protein